MYDIRVQNNYDSYNDDKLGNIPKTTTMLLTAIKITITLKRIWTTKFLITLIILKMRGTRYYEKFLGFNKQFAHEPM